MYLPEIYFFSFIRRIIKIYKVFPNRNPEIVTNPPVSEANSRLVGFFLNTIIINIHIFQADVPAQVPLALNNIMIWKKRARAIC